MRTFFMLAAGLGLLLSAPVLAEDPPSPLGVLTSLEGTARILRKGQSLWEEARPFIWLYEGDCLEASPGSKAFVVTPGGARSLGSGEKLLLEGRRYKGQPLAMEIGPTLSLEAVRGGQALVALSPRGRTASLRPPLLWLGPRPADRVSLALSPLDKATTWNATPTNIAVRPGGVEPPGLLRVALAYPQGWPTLEPGRAYVWQVVVDGQSSGEIPFVAPDQALSRDIEQLKATLKPHPPSTRDFGLAAFFRGRGAEGDAIRCLWKIEQEGGPALTHTLLSLYHGPHLHTPIREKEAQ